MRRGVAERTKQGTQDTEREDVLKQVQVLLIDCIMIPVFCLDDRQTASAYRPFRERDFVCISASSAPYFQA